MPAIRYLWWPFLRYGKWWDACSMRWYILRDVVSRTHVREYQKPDLQGDEAARHFLPRIEHDVATGLGRTCVSTIKMTCLLQILTSCWKEGGFCACSGRCYDASGVAGKLVSREAPRAQTLDHDHQNHHRTQNRSQGCGLLPPPTTPPLVRSPYPTLSRPFAGAAPSRPSCTGRTGPHDEEIF